MVEETPLFNKKEKLKQCFHASLLRLDTVQGHCARPLLSRSHKRSLEFVSLPRPYSSAVNSSSQFLAVSSLCLLAWLFSFYTECEGWWEVLLGRRPRAERQPRMILKEKETQRNGGKKQEQKKRETDSNTCAFVWSKMKTGCDWEGERKINGLCSWERFQEAETERGWEEGGCTHPLLSGLAASRLAEPVVSRCLRVTS